jgi:predicted Zn-dependent peptidase
MLQSALMPKLIQKTLPNGLRFYAMPLVGTSAVTTLVMYQVGSRYETNDIAGISHFLEHLMFKGTKKRPTPRFVSRELDNLGAEYNAFTSKDLTGYYIKSAAEHFDKGFNVLADMLLHSKFSADGIKRERHVIVEEMRMYRDNPLMHIEDLFEQVAFGKTHLGREIIGSEKTVLGTTRANIVKYWETYYHPRNMAVIVAGAVDPARAWKHVQTQFKHLDSRRRVPYLSCVFHQSEPQVALHHRGTEQSQLAMGFPAFSYTHPRLTILEVLHGILGSGMSSRLFETIREQKGLAYSIRTGITPYEDNGLFYVRAGLDPKKTLHAVESILKEFSRVKRELVTTEELRRAKQYLNGQLALELEESDAYAGWIARQALFMPDIESVDQYREKINSVTREQIRDVAREIMNPAKVNLALIGPFKNKALFEKAVKRFR